MTIPWIILFAFIVIEWAHIASPIVLAWSHPGLRQIALSRPIETMLLPTVAIVGALVVPFPVIQWVRYGGHLWHFGSQHYGIARLLGWRVNRWVCIVPTAAIMASTLVITNAWWGWFVIVAIDLQHWVVDLGLSARVSRWWMFGAAVAAFGCAGLCWKIAQPHWSMAAIALTIQARWGVDIVHYLYSRWVWKLSDPQVRATIGRDLFVQA